MISLDHITVACDDADRLAAFWAGALSYEREALAPADADVEVSDVELVVDPDGGPDLLFKEMSKVETEDAPLHLDLAVDDRTAAVERLCERGASVRRTRSEQFGSGENTWTVMEDPEGNGFCVFE